MSIDLTPLLTALIGVLVLTLTALAATEVVPRVQRLWKPFKDAYPVEAAFLESQAANGVKAAAQSMPDAEGYQKLEYALTYVEGQAKRYGYSFDRDAVETLIEAKYHDLKQLALSLGK